MIRTTVQLSDKAKAFLSSGACQARQRKLFDSFILSQTAEVEAATYLIEIGLLQNNMRDFVRLVWLREAQKRSESKPHD